MSTSATVENLDLARQAILAPADIGEAELEQVFGQLLAPSVDAADLYFQVRRHESWVLEDGIVKEGSRNLDQGVGVRAMSGERTGFAYSDEIVMPALLEASSAARSIVRSGAHGRLQAWETARAAQLYQPVNPLETLTAEDKVDLLRRVDAEARRLDSRVDQVMVSLVGVHETVLVAGSDGRLAADVRPLVRLNVTVLAGQGDRRESGTSGGGGRFGYGYLLEGDRCLTYARVARSAAPRGGGPRAGGRLQPQGHLGVLRPDGRAGGLAAVHGGGRRHHGGTPRLAERG